MEEGKTPFMSLSIMTTWVANFFTQGFNFVWEGLTERAKAIAKEGAHGIFEDFLDVTPADWDAKFEDFKKLGLIDDNDIKVLQSLKGLPLAKQSAAMLLLHSGLITSYLSNILEARAGTMIQNMNRDYSPLPAQPREVMAAAFIAPEKTAEVRDAMRRSGLSEGDIDLMFLSVYRLYDENIIRILWLRKEIDDSKLYERMRELGYTDTRTAEVVKTWEVIPGIQDILFMVAKEAFEPDAVELMGLEDEFPVSQLQWAEKQGISEFWMRKYWSAHWQQPGIEMGLEMLHRKVINEEELDMLFRTVETPPFWRGKIKQIAYNVLTRVDTRRMHKMGVLDDEELISVYEDQGYSRKNAVRMAKFTVLYNQEKERELTKTEVMTSYRAEAMTKEAALALLQKLNYPETEALYLLTFEDYKREKEYREDMVKIIGERYQTRLIDKTKVRAELGQLNLKGRETELLITKWDLKLMKDVKFPSKSDLDKFLRKKIINEDEYTRQMDLIGYGTMYIDWYKQSLRNTMGE